MSETTVGPVRAEALRGAYGERSRHDTTRVMPALADVCPLLPMPVLAPREVPETPTSCPRPLAAGQARDHDLSQSERGLSE